jgi:hypothetical protein
MIRPLQLKYETHTPFLTKISILLLNESVLRFFYCKRCFLLTYSLTHSQKIVPLFSQEDERLLKDFGHTLSYRHLCAIKLRLSEKRILNSILSHIQHQMNSLEKRFLK